MKKLDKAILMIFSVIILIEGIILDLLIVGWLDYKVAGNIIRQALITEPANKVILVISVLSVLLAIKALLWGEPSSSKKERKSNGKDVLMQNDNGRLMISVDTIESLVNAVVSQFASVQDTKTNILVDAENNVSVLVNLIVTKDVIIKDLTLNIQNKIKEAIKKTSDLEVKEVNVRIKDVVSVPEAENK